MSNIYITEPPTFGKIVLHTSVGEIEVELWSKEAPKASRNFVQLCLEGYYNKTPFHRVIKDFIVQGGDPTGTGEGGESIYGQPFKTETHSRLRFNRRGLLSMVCPEPDTNRSQFFFTLAAAPELDKKHTIFGKIVGDTIYNLLKLAEGSVDQNDRPENLHYVNKTEVIINPFPDIVVREKILHETDADEKLPKSKAKATKNFSLLSFGEEVEEEEMDSRVENQIKTKGKSAHDLLNDPRLAKDIEEEDDGVDSIVSTSQMDVIREKLQRNTTTDSSKDEKVKKIPHHVTLEEEVEIKKMEKMKRKDELQQESERIRQDIARLKYRQQLDNLREAGDLKRQQEESTKRLNTDNDLLNEIRREQVMYRSHEEDNKSTTTTQNVVEEAEDEVVKVVDSISVKKHGEKHHRQTKNEVNNEQKTMEFLSRFRNRLHKLVAGEVEPNPEVAGFDGLASKLDVDDVVEVKVLDANVFDPERYPLDDPRNPINVRKRKAAKESMKEKKRSRRS